MKIKRGGVDPWKIGGGEIGLNIIFLACSLSDTFANESFRIRKGADKY